MCTAGRASGRASSARRRSAKDAERNTEERRLSARDAAQPGYKDTQSLDKLSNGDRKAMAEWWWDEVD